MNTGRFLGNWALWDFWQPRRGPLSPPWWASSALVVHLGLRRGWGSTSHNLRPAPLSCNLIQDQSLLGSQLGCDSDLMGSPRGGRNGVELADLSFFFFGEWQLDLIVP